METKSSLVYECFGLVKTSFVGPNSISSPSHITAIRSHICAATRRSWIIKSIDRLSLFRISANNCKICAWIDTSGADTGSSAIKISEANAHARAMAIPNHGFFFNMLSKIEHLSKPNWTRIILSLFFTDILTFLIISCNSRGTLAHAPF
jgi:hypothetical protein